MPKYLSLEDYVNTFSESGKSFYYKLIQAVDKSDTEIEKKLFAGQLAFFKTRTLKRTFHESPVVVFAFLKDHVNIFSVLNNDFKERFRHHKYTKKMTLQLYFDKPYRMDDVVSLIKISVEKE